MSEIEVPEGCALSLYEEDRAEKEHEDSEGRKTTEVTLTAKAECACGQWAKEVVGPQQSIEYQARNMWLFSHLSDRRDAISNARGEDKEA